MDKKHTGKRIRLIYTSDPYTNLVLGDLGTVLYEDDAETLHVKWDKHSSMGLIPNEDEWEFVKE